MLFCRTVGMKEWLPHCGHLNRSRVNAITGWKVQCRDSRCQRVYIVGEVCFHGTRDGASVNAEARFTDGADSLTMNIALYLVPPPEFRSGTYEGTIGGKMIKGQVDCPSIAFFGGQSDQPSVGGVFLLKDEQNRSVYRIRIPATRMSRR